MDVNICISIYPDAARAHDIQCTKVRNIQDGQPSDFSGSSLPCVLQVGRMHVLSCGADNMTKVWQLTFAQSGAVSSITETAAQTKVCNFTPPDLHMLVPRQ